MTIPTPEPDPDAGKRGFDAMKTRKKIDIATIEAARRGGEVCKECLNEDSDSCVCPEPEN